MNAWGQHCVYRTCYWIVHRHHDVFSLVQMMSSQLLVTSLWILLSAHLDDGEFVQGMVTSQSASVRIRAFDLIMNLGVHAHLLEPMQSDDQTISEEPSGSGNLSMENGSFSSFVSLPVNRGGDRRRLNRSHLDTSTETFLEKPERGSPPAVGRFETWLLDILCEMLLLLVQVILNPSPRLSLAEEVTHGARLSISVSFLFSEYQVYMQRRQISSLVVLLQAHPLMLQILEIDFL